MTSTEPQRQLPVLLEPPERVLSTLNDDGSRRWLSPRLSRGVWLERRRAVAYGLILLFTVIPHLRMGGRPLILIDIPKREFTFFGFTLLPTDTLILAFFVLGVLLSVFLVTALFGRIWCGWACPQTVYMEFLFRPIERLFLGTAGRGGPPSARASAGRRVALYAVYLLISCLLAHTFLAYFVGTDALARWVRQSPLEHPIPFLVMAFVTGMMMFNFSYFREQTCILACPYGRLQSVLLDRDSLIVSYDRRRGEPRGRMTHAPGAAPQGDCIDCHLCVATCPTGIDIRDGLQLECVHCAQCIDACDAVMRKVNRPPGLIRYGSQNAVSGEVVRTTRWRIILYPAILLVVGAGLALAIANRRPVDVRVLRSPGPPFAVLPDGRIANAMRLKLTNRTSEPARYHVAPRDAAGIELRLDHDDITVLPGRTETRGMLVVAARDQFTAGRAQVTLIVTDGAGAHVETPCALLGPARDAEPAP
ncbi:MAG: cytochrome c oxidase accessory protein CcoG [Phycisphaerales bacterium]|nr:cytochrome c oxidase accessory protein CcoG [Phycisphaerales bacterium]